MTHTCVLCKRKLALAEFYLSCDCEAAHGVCQSCFEVSGVNGDSVRDVVQYGKKHMGDHRIMRRKAGSEDRESLGAKLLFEQGDLSGVTAIALGGARKPQLPRWATVIITVVWFAAVAYVGRRLGLPAASPIAQGVESFLLDHVMRLPVYYVGIALPWLTHTMRWVLSAMMVCAIPHLFFHAMEESLT
jgi:hypothetical protein